MKKIGKKDGQKGITMIALIITIVILIILASVSISLVIGDDGIITVAQQTKENMEVAQEEEKSDLKELLYQMEDGMGSDYNTYKQVNHPKLATGMTAIKYTDPTESSKGEIVETTSGDVNWYDYSAKKWANAQTKDGSMWVWIPRYAYRLNSSTKTFDIVFLIGTTDEYYDENGEKQTAKRCTSTDEIVDTTTGYTVHPAFTDETAINYQNGGWDKEITGIWVAKFEAGYASGNNNATVKASNVNYSETDSWIYATERGEDGDGTEAARNWLDGIYGTTTTAIKYPVFQPLTYSMNYINHNDAYNIAKALTDNGNIYGLTSKTDSHLMKNSEWGAVAYLAQSKYGLNGADITINNISLNSGGAARTATAGQTGVDSVYGVTGCTSNSTSDEEKQTTIAAINGTTGNTANDGVYTWNQKAGTSSSCTGTIYGIYDLSGGQWERIASYIANGNANLKNSGASIAYNGSTLKTMSTKYTMVYPYNSTTDNTGITNSEENKNTASENSGISAFEHFVGADKTIKMPKGATKNIKEYKLTRYACYLIAQNGDSRKEVIALAQTYFAIQTRKQEISEKEYSLLTEDEKRFYQRDLTRKGNYSLNQTAKNAGVKNFDKFHNAGYKGLYNGETADDIAKRKGLRYREDILDNMGSDELIANLFRISQTEQKLKRDNVQTEKDAYNTHNKIGKIVRKAIEEAGGTMPEDLPTPKKSLKQLEKENKKSLVK